MPCSRCGNLKNGLFLLRRLSLCRRPFRLRIQVVLQAANAEAVLLDRLPVYQQVAARLDRAVLGDGLAHRLRRPEVRRPEKSLETVPARVVEARWQSVEPAGVVPRRDDPKAVRRYRHRAVVHQVQHVGVVGHVPSVGADALHEALARRDRGVSAAYGEANGGVPRVESAVNRQVAVLVGKLVRAVYHAGCVGAGPLPRSRLGGVTRRPHIAVQPAVVPQEYVSVCVRVGIRNVREAAHIYHVVKQRVAVVLAVEQAVVAAWHEMHRQHLLVRQSKRVVQLVDRPHRQRDVRQAVVVQEARAVVRRVVLPRGYQVAVRVNRVEVEAVNRLHVVLAERRVVDLVQQLCLLKALGNLGAPEVLGLVVEHLAERLRHVARLAVAHHEPVRKIGALALRREEEHCCQRQDNQ